MNLGHLSSTTNSANSGETRAIKVNVAVLDLLMFLFGLRSPAHKSTGCPSELRPELPAPID